MRHEDWISSLPGTPSREQAARNGNVSPSTVSRQLRRGGLSMENVRNIARGNGLYAVEELLKTGLLTYNDLGNAPVAATLKAASERELIEELLTRTHPESGRWKDKITPANPTAVDFISSPRVMICEPPISPVKNFLQTKD